MQDVCPEVVADVVANADDMLSGVDHVESRCIEERGVNDKIAMRVVGKDTDTEDDFIEREKLLSVVLVVLKPLLKYLTEERHKRCSLGIFQ
ncbi:hypothetical protein DY000_02058719 [Brassica cretica]|nr:hypothetical protein DY000_02058719 [Brassica cretica]